MVENTNPPLVVVIDASAALAKLLPDEKQLREVEKYYRQFAQNKLNFAAPTLLKFEVANALRSAVIQDRLSSKIARKLLIEFLKLPIYYEETNLAKVFDTALKYNLSVYDASYAFLALEKGVGLVSLDKKLTQITLGR